MAAEKDVIGDILGDDDDLLYLSRQSTGASDPGAGRGAAVEETVGTSDAHSSARGDDRAEDDELYAVDGFAVGGGAAAPAPAAASAAPATRRRPRRRRSRAAGRRSGCRRTRGTSS